LEIQNRHHWIDANLDTFQRAFAPLDEHPQVLPGVSQPLNTASVAGSLAFIARHVLGQYDPLLLADGDDPHGLFFVHPNIVAAADALAVDQDRFRRWIAFHEVTHAAEFGAAPWLSEYLSGRLREAIDALADRQVPREALGELDLAMTAVEGYAELLMDHAFDAAYDDLRRKLDARRKGGDRITKLIRRLLGFRLKRRQYERGRSFFDAVVAERGIAGASIIWEDPAFLPGEAELENPERWLDRVPDR
ncbi:MAG: zinc-dependent metalloprotease, partial [Halodesulfurarchaeum sp.]